MSADITALLEDLVRRGKLTVVGFDAQPGPAGLLQRQHYAVPRQSGTVSTDSPNANSSND